MNPLCTDLFLSISISSVTGYLSSPIYKTNHIDWICRYFAIVNFLTVSPTLQAEGWLVIGFRERCACAWLRALLNWESWQFTSVSLPLALSLRHTHTNTHRFCACVRERRGSPLVCVRGRLVSAYVARDIFVCISRAYCLDRENENGWDCNYWMEISTQCEIRKGWAKTSHGHRR